MSLAIRSELILVAAVALAVEAAAQAPNPTWSNSGSKPWVVTRGNLGDVNGKNDRVLYDFNTEDEARACASALNEKESNLNILYEAKKRPDFDPPAGADPAPPKPAPKLAPIVKLPPVDPGPYRFMDGYNDPFKKNEPVDLEKALVNTRWRYVTLLGRADPGTGARGLESFLEFTFNGKGAVKIYGESHVVEPRYETTTGTWKAVGDKKVVIEGSPWGTITAVMDGTGLVVTVPPRSDRKGFSMRLTRR